MWFSNFETKVILLKLLTRISSSHLFLSNAIYTVDNNPKAPREYTTNLYSKIPMKQLLLFTRGDEQNYGDLYPPLLKYIVTYYPHLCLVEDWMDEEEIGSSSLAPPKDQKKVMNSTGAVSSLRFGEFIFIQSKCHYAYN